MDSDRQPHSDDFKMIILKPLTIFANDSEHIKASYDFLQGIKNETISILPSKERYFYWDLDQASPVAQMVKNLPVMQETWVQTLGWEDLLEKEMATHSSILFIV